MTEFKADNRQDKNSMPLIIRSGGIKSVLQSIIKVLKQYLDILKGDIKAYPISLCVC